MADETPNLGNTNPDDNREPGAGGGHQPASFLLTNEPIDRPGARSGFETGDTERNAADDAIAAVADSDPAATPETIADKLAYAREHLGDDVFVLEEGSEIFNTGGLRVVLLTPAAVRLEGGSPDPVVNDQRFASFLHPSDRNWGLNIKQLERSYDRARNVALPLVCERHGEDLEWEAYGKPRQCPKCAEEALKAAAEAPSADMIKVGDVVKLRDDETAPPRVVSNLRDGIATCVWISDKPGLPEEGRLAERYNLDALRLASPEEREGMLMSAGMSSLAGGVSKPDVITAGSIVKVRDNPELPAMRILSVSSDQAVCVWYDASRQRQQETFNVANLRFARLEERWAVGYPAGVEDYFEDLDFPESTADKPETPAPPIAVGSVVKLREDEAWPAMTVISVEFGIANCQWFDERSQLQGKLFGIGVLRHARPEDGEALPTTPE